MKLGVMVSACFSSLPLLVRGLQFSRGAHPRFLPLGSWVLAHDSHLANQSLVEKEKLFPLQLLSGEVGAQN